MTVGRLGSRCIALLRPVATAVRRLVAGGRTAVLALLGSVAVVAFLALCIVGLWRCIPAAARLLRRLADSERRRLARDYQPAIVGRYDDVTGSVSQRILIVLHDPATRRDLLWMLIHGPFGLISAVLAIGLPAGVLNALLLPMYWWAVPGGVPSSVGYVVDSWGKALLSPVVAVAYGAVVLVVLPGLARAEYRIAATLLSPRADQVLSLRVAELAATRAAALEAHGAELRRIERDLHDGTQNRLTAVAMHLGILERALLRADVAGLEPSVISLVLRAQDATSDALTGLREVIRSIYPPVLGERGLDGAIAALAAGSAVPCSLRMGVVPRMPAAVETAAYFAVAESLTNVARHSQATEATVRVETDGRRLMVEISDDGVGAATERPGGGLAGIRRRVAAFDGAVTLSSPPGGPTVLRLELPA
ncbi:sensor histidine kinase [Dactylosporangium sp. NPDC048998]|uniref:sensor histidine kinase n=1 Tax=Dactylosporangium sp. NPDC048998 TaxID=3363976 RepID=UPI00371FAE05